MKLFFHYLTDLLTEILAMKVKKKYGKLSLS